MVSIGVRARWNKVNQYESFAEYIRLLANRYTSHYGTGQAIQSGIEIKSVIISNTQIHACTSNKKKKKMKIENKKFQRTSFIIYFCIYFKYSQDHQSIAEESW